MHIVGNIMQESTKIMLDANASIISRNMLYARNLPCI